MDVAIVPYTLHFRTPAGTSRGIYHQRKVHYVLLRRGESYGVGECAPLQGLSHDYVPHYDRLLQQAARELITTGEFNVAQWQKYPSICFGFETALQMLQNGITQWHSPFARGEEGIAINGLVWMNGLSQMHAELQQKCLIDGFRCLKIKIGGIRFEEELSLIRWIRQHGDSEIVIRADANGAFDQSNVFARLEQLAAYNIHSLEQPVKAGNAVLMEKICRESPVPIALDEELIGIYDHAAKQLIQYIKPQYLVLKPSLHGGIVGTEKWRHIADEMAISYWITSALESNIGLTALSQWTAALALSHHQGLGTGMLYTNNIAMPLSIEKGKLWWDCHASLSAKELYEKLWILPDRFAILP